MAETLVTSFKAPLDMQVDLSSVDEFSGELSRHTPNAAGVSPVCLLEIAKHPKIMNRESSDKHILYFNCFLMMPSTTRKEKVQVQLYKKGTDRIIMPTMADHEYTIAVLAKDVSHYVTRSGAVFKLMMHMELCQLCTFYKDFACFDRHNIEALHSALFIHKERCSAHYMQSVSTVKIVLASVGVDRYSEKFLVSTLFLELPLEFHELYQKKRQENGTNWSRFLAF